MKVNPRYLSPFTIPKDVSTVTKTRECVSVLDAEGQQIKIHGQVFVHDHTHHHSGVEHDVFGSEIRRSRTDIVEEHAVYKGPDSQLAVMTQFLLMTEDVTAKRPSTVFESFSHVLVTEGSKTDDPTVPVTYWMFGLDDAFHLPLLLHRPMADHAVAVNPLRDDSASDADRPFAVMPIH